MSARTPKANPTPARLWAVRQLERIEADRAFVGLVAADALEDESRDAREERQATEYVAGVTRWRRRLDFLAASFYRGDYESVEPTLRQILRLGLYDLLYLDTPPHAALNESVELAKHLLRRGAGGLVNGILRSVLRSKDRLPEPRSGDPADDLGVAHSHPTWLVRRWLGQFGTAETIALLEWNNRRPSYGIRANPRKATVSELGERLGALGVDWEASPYLYDFVRVQRLQPVIRSGLLAEGAAAVQDESAGLVVRVLDPRPGETLLDACAAPGGKSLYAAERMEGTGTILAFDVHAGRLRLVDRAAKAHGTSSIRTEAADLRDLARRPDRPTADRVLLDAPCSGLGVLSKRADLRWNRSADDLAGLVALQDELLDAAAALVRPGGLLVYATCSIEPDENHRRVEAFLKRSEAFRREPAGEAVPDALVTPDGDFASFPQRHGIDGAYASRLRHVGAETP